MLPFEWSLSFFMQVGIILLALIGLATVLNGCWRLGRFIYLFSTQQRLLSEEEISKHKDKVIGVADQKAKELVNSRMQNIWFSLSSVAWTDPAYLKKEGFQLIRDIAAVYYPSSNTPEMEVTIIELLHLNERISQKLRVLFDPFKPLHQISVADIFSARDLFERTKSVMEMKGLKRGRRLAGRVWQGLNVLRPQYWVGRLLYKGASEMIGRKLLVSAFRIIGAESIQVYRASSMANRDFDFDDIDADETSQEKKVEDAEESFKNINDPLVEQELKGEEEMAQQAGGSEVEKRGRLNEMLTQTLNRFFEGSLNVWDRLSKPDPIIASYQKQGNDVKTLKDIQTLPVEVMDKTCDGYIKKGSWYSAAEGAATGLGGALTMAADAVSLLALQLRTIQQIGYCFGFDVRKPDERMFAAKLLAEAYNHPSKKEKEAVIKEMRLAANLIRGKTPLGLLQRRLFVQGTSRIAQKIGLRLGGRKTAQLIPIIGMVAGGVINKKVTHDIAVIAKEVYHDRLINQRGEQTDNP